MGLDVDAAGWTGECARWSYSGFHRFRVRVARLAGIDLDTMETYSGESPWSGVNDALKPLLHHSDCEGELSPDECATVAPRLAELIARMDGAGDTDESYDASQGTILVAMMLHCASQRTPLVFS